MFQPVLSIMQDDLFSKLFPFARYRLRLSAQRTAALLDLLNGFGKVVMPCKPYAKTRRNWKFSIRINL